MKKKCNGIHRSFLLAIVFLSATAYATVNSAWKMFLGAITLCFLNFRYAQAIVDSKDHFKIPDLDLNHVINLTRFQVKPAKIDLNKKFLPKQKTIQNFNIDA